LLFLARAKGQTIHPASRSAKSPPEKKNVEGGGSIVGISSKDAEKLADRKEELAER